jgi:hypothetical protein
MINMVREVRVKALYPTASSVIGFIAVPLIDKVGAFDT